MPTLKSCNVIAMRDGGQKVDSSIAKNSMPERPRGYCLAARHCLRAAWILGRLGPLPRRAGVNRKKLEVDVAPISVKRVTFIFIRLEDCKDEVPFN